VAAGPAATGTVGAGLAGIAEAALLSEIDGLAAVGLEARLGSGADGSVLRVAYPTTAIARRTSTEVTPVRRRMGRRRREGIAGGTPGGARRFPSILADASDIAA
jgi:hypothetical protein